MHKSFNLAEVIEKAKKQAGQVDTYFYQSQINPVEFKFNKLYSANRIYATGIGVRVIKNGRIGFSSTTNLDKIDQVITRAVESAQYGQEAKFDMPALTEYKKPQVFDNEITDFSVESAIQRGEKGIDEILSKHPDVMCESSIDTSQSYVQLANSTGLNVEYKKTVFSIWFTALLQEKEGGFQMIWDGETGCKLALINVDDKIESVKHLLTLSRVLLPFKTQKLPVLFMPRTMHNLLQASQLATNGKTLQKGICPLSGKEGKQVFDRRISISDDPFIDYMAGSRPFDGEGIAAQKTPLFREGVLENFIFDLQTAGLLKKKTTGNGLRSYSSQPTPAYTNYVVEGGDVPLNQIIKQMERGVIVYDCIGGGQSNLLAGDFSLNIGLGFLVENGEIKGRIKNAMVAGNIFQDFLNNIRAVSSERQSFYNTITPAFCFGSMKVVGKG